jgi:hypothetical protein
VGRLGSGEVALLEDRAQQGFAARDVAQVVDREDHRGLDAGLA